MKLYYSPGACSLAPMILAQWLDIPLELERARPGTDEFKKKNPLGAVPALEMDNGEVRNQVDAILQYFCALKPGSGLDGSGDLMDHFEVHRWAAFLTGDFHPPFGVWFNPRRFTTDHSDESLAAVKEASAARVLTLAQTLDDQVGDSNHIALGRRTFLDGYAFSMVRWLKNLDGGVEAFPNLARFMADMKTDSGVQAALSLERS